MTTLQANRILQCEGLACPMPVVRTKRSIPLGELEERLHELDPGVEYVLVCRTGNRSDTACRILEEKGFKQLQNAIQGMSHWAGELEQD